MKELTINMLDKKFQIIGSKTTVCWKQVWFKMLTVALNQLLFSLLPALEEQPTNQGSAVCVSKDKHAKTEWKHGLICFKIAQPKPSPTLTKAQSCPA